MSNKFVERVRAGLDFAKRYGLVHWTIGIISFVCLLVRFMAPEVFSAEADRVIAIFATVIVCNYSMRSAKGKNDVD